MILTWITNYSPHISETFEDQLLISDDQENMCDAKNLSIDELKNIFTKCIDQMSNDSPNDLLYNARYWGTLYNILLQLAEYFGDYNYLYRCEQCGDSVVDHIIKFDDAVIKYTEGCIQYNLSVNNKTILDTEDMSIDGYKEIIKKIMNIITDSPENHNIMIDLVSQLVEDYGEVDEDYYKSSGISKMVYILH